jgi:ribose transport system permease protein
VSYSLSDRIESERLGFLSWFGDRRSVIVPFAVFVCTAALLQIVNPTLISYFDVSTISASATTLVLAALGETIVILAGGLDLSSGAVISLVNVVLVTQLGDAAINTPLYALFATAMGIGLGGAVGAVNGFLIGYTCLQPVIVTLATMFITQGAALLILKYPGGSFSNEFSTLLVGDVIRGWLPAPLVVVAVAIVLWLYLKNTRLGIAIYAVGSDAERVNDFETAQCGI